MIKKLISTTLCMVTLCQMGNFYSCAFDWPWPDTENKCEVLKDVKIAYDSCLNDLKEGKGVCSQLKVGPKCETDLWLWGLCANQRGDIKSKKMFFKHGKYDR